VVRAHDAERLLAARDLLAEDVDRGQLALPVEPLDDAAGVRELRPRDVPLGDSLHDRLRNRRQEAGDRTVEQCHGRAILCGSHLTTSTFQ
jgi:hypothetical protein